MIQTILRIFLALAWTASLCLPAAMPAQAASSDQVLGAVATVAAPATDASPSPIPVAQLTLNVASGSKGTAVIITGTGFPPGEIVAIYVDAAGPYLANPPPGPTAGAQGNVRVNVTWPGKNYDSSGHVDPTIPGPHTVCGDTAYPGSTQQIPARACAQFQVVAVASNPTAPPATSNASLPVGAVLIAFVVLMVLTGGLLLLTRRSDSQRSRSAKGRGDSS